MEDHFGVLRLPEQRHLNHRIFESEEANARRLEGQAMFLERPHVPQESRGG
jgi:hypothetical protein